MITIQLHPDLDEIASFIARNNSIPENHIGYCGKEKAEILHSMKEDLTDVDAKNAFVTAVEENEIVGVCGFDADLERESAELWGPFVHHRDAQRTAKLLWQAVIRKMPDAIHTVSLFPDQRNSMVLDFAAASGFQPVSDQTILTCSRQSLIELNSDDDIIKLPSRLYNALIALHDQIFPNTYLSGREMIDGLEEHATVLAAIDKNQRLAGYLYAEAEPEIAEGSIEFFGVDPSARGGGLGTALLARGLQWLFSFQEIEDISLCVRSDNAKAIHLYEKVGFQIQHELRVFEKSI